MCWRVQAIYDPAHRNQRVGGVWTSQILESDVEHVEGGHARQWRYADARRHHVEAGRDRGGHHTEAAAHIHPVQIVYPGCKVKYTLRSGLRIERIRERRSGW